MSGSPSSVTGRVWAYMNVDMGPSIGWVRRPMFNQRVVVASGAVDVQGYDFEIVIDKAVPAATTVNLPSARTWLLQPYGVFPLLIKDGGANAGTNNITITPNGAETIDGLASLIIASDGGSVTLRPTEDGNWSTSP